MLPSKSEGSRQLYLTSKVSLSGVELDTGSNPQHNVVLLWSTKPDTTLPKICTSECVHDYDINKINKAEIWIQELSPSSRCAGRNALLGRHDITAAELTL